MYNISTADVLERGMNCLIEQLGVVDAERFISTLIREKYDYTKWRRDLFGDAGVEEINNAAKAYDEMHPFRPKKEQIGI